LEPPLLFRAREGRSWFSRRTFGCFRWLSTLAYSEVVVPAARRVVFVESLIDERQAALARAYREAGTELPNFLEIARRCGGRSRRYARASCCRDGSTRPATGAHSAQLPVSVRTPPARPVEPARDRAYRRDRHAQLAGDRRPTHALPAQPRDLTDPLRRDAMLATLGRRAAVTQFRRAAASVACQPAIALPLRYAGRRGRFHHPPTQFLDPLHQQASTLRRQARILV
jgi:hypothetical protein